MLFVSDFLSADDTSGPLTGTAGKLFNSMLNQAGVHRDESKVTAVFNLIPEGKADIESFCGPKAEALAGYPAVKQSKYVRSIYAAQLSRLAAQIKEEQPNIIVALGPVAAWALLGIAGIKKVRGAPSYVDGFLASALAPLRPKVIPTYHPGGIMREWSLRAIAISDIEKAARESLYPEIRRPQRFVHVEPTVADLLEFEQAFILSANALSIDIETAGDQITCVGFAPSIDRAIVVPFVDPIQKDGNYWRTIEEEIDAWMVVKRWCMMTVPREHRPPGNEHLPYKGGVGQNFLYDMHRMWKGMGIRVNNEDDTMLLHHALQPEMEKGLGFLATLYTDELAWKFMRAKHETLKKEDN